MGDGEMSAETITVAGMIREIRELRAEVERLRSEQEGWGAFARTYVERAKRLAAVARAADNEARCSNPGGCCERYASGRHHPGCPINEMPATKNALDALEPGDIDDE